MKQLLQHISTGETVVTDVPVPKTGRGMIMVQVGSSLVSAGTERMVVDFAEKSLIQKARSRPDLVRQTMDKAQREGVLTTLDAVRNRLDRPMSLGYSCAGVVTGVGSDITEFQPGDRVACAGAGYAVHAEIVVVPRNLAVKLPEGVDFDSAAFTTLGAIALQGIRLADVKLGEVVAVIGLGLLGQLTVQMLKAAGCVVAGMDLQPARAEMARAAGADGAAASPEDLAALVERLSGGHSADCVLLTADTKSNGPVELAGELARANGTVVAIGAVGMTIPRKVYYEKELDFRISRSYGPGRYDPEYEEQGRDYPIGYVRWTENRNMQAFVQLLGERKLNVQPLISHRIPIDEAARAYEIITGKTTEPFLGVVLTYPGTPDLSRRVNLNSPATVSNPAPPPPSKSSVRVGLLGAGNYALVALLPAMQKVSGVEMVGVCTTTGMSARHAAEKFSFRYCATDEKQLINDPDLNTVVIATRHNAHAQQAAAAMQAGKDIFVEKPLALNRDELLDVMRVQRKTGQRLMVGFNRRFAPMVVEMKRFLDDRRRPVVAGYRVNAGAIPLDHWTQDPVVGGGRIIGEGCHFVDLLQFLLGAPPVTVSCHAIETSQGPVEDEVMIVVSFADGSVGTIFYAAGGDKAFSKERLEIIGAGKVAVLDDFRSLELVHNGKRIQRKERLRPDKGQKGEWEALAAAVRSGGPTPIAPEQTVATHLAVFAAVESLRTQRPVAVDTEAFWQEVSQ
ncbi:MAG: bi-domain-containing oxidoreductase [Armatimonadota bacterium]|nr:bi-domain-containing oxidoreductase [Armatimonadota bacterium]